MELRKTIHKELYKELMDIFGQSYASDLLDEPKNADKMDQKEKEMLVIDQLELKKKVM